MLTNHGLPRNSKSLTDKKKEYITNKEDQKSGKC